MGISTRSDHGRTPPNTADSDPARSTQTRESIVAFKLPSHSGGLSLPESWGRPQDDLRMYVSRVARIDTSLCFRHVSTLRLSLKKKKKKKRGKENPETIRGLWWPAGRDTRSDVRSALTCWIRRECDAKVSRSAAASTRFDPGKGKRGGVGRRHRGGSDNRQMEDAPLIVVVVVAFGRTPRAPGSFVRGLPVARRVTSVTRSFLRREFCRHVVRGHFVICQLATLCLLLLRIEFFRARSYDRLSRKFRFVWRFAHWQPAAITLRGVNKDLERSKKNEARWQLSFFVHDVNWPLIYNRLEKSDSTLLIFMYTFVTKRFR